MKGGEMDGYFSAQMLLNPATQRNEFFVGIMFTWNKQSGDFKPDIGFMF